MELWGIFWSSDERSQSRQEHHPHKPCCILICFAWSFQTCQGSPAAISAGTSMTLIITCVLRHEYKILYGHKCAQQQVRVFEEAVLSARAITWQHGIQASDMARRLGLTWVPL